MVAMLVSSFEWTSSKMCSSLHLYRASVVKLPSTMVEEHAIGLWQLDPVLALTQSSLYVGT